MKTILLVEDHPDLGALYQEELGDAGYHTFCVDNGQDALKHMAEQSFDLVVLDINMPGMNGIEVLERMLEVQPGLTVIINSGYESYKASFLSWSAAAFVVKSSDLTELKAQIQRVLALQEPTWKA